MPFTSVALLADVASRLRASGSVFAEEEARILLEAAPARDYLDRLVAERVAGRPLEHVVGWAEFCALRVAVGPGVFVPRRRTELLARTAATRLPAGRRPVVVDLCCGSGAVGAALLAGRPDVELHAVDVDPVAVSWARRNVEGAGGAVHLGDLYDVLPPALRGRVDVLVANAPYVPSGEVGLMPPEAREHEPLTALDGGVDGLDVQRRVVAEAPGWLTPTGHLLVETSRGQAARTADLFTRAGLRSDLFTSEELDGTVVVGRPE